jgi:phosphopantothenoylcysteine synthetase/decarboxylase
VCGAPLTARTPDLVRELLAEGWKPTVIGTPAAAEWLDDDAVTRLVGEPPRFDYRSPSQPKRGGPPAAVVVCPATFNTINKAAAGINDTYALGVLCEAIGTSTPTVAVPMVNNKLWGHPAWAGSLGVLAEAGVVLLDVHSGSAGAAPVISGTGGEVTAGFDPRWVTRQLNALRESADR